MPNIKRETLQNEILGNVKYGTTVYTDDAVGYEHLHSRFVHDVVNHAETYVRGRVHTNGMEKLLVVALEANLARNLRCCWDCFISIDTSMNKCFDSITAKT